MPRLEPWDRWLVGAWALLAALGIVAVASASLDVAAVRYGHPYAIVLRWLGFWLVALGALALGAYTPPERWRALAPVLFLVTLLGCVLVHAPGIGRTANGAARWLSIAGMSVQPAEFALAASVLFFARVLERGEQARLGPLVVGALLLCGALLAQPDYGDAALVLLLAFAMAFAAGVAARKLLVVAFIGLLVLAALAVVAPYRLARLGSFLNPWADRFGAGYQLAQSLLAFGSGGLWGAGLGEGVQKLFYLPEVFTDFIAAVIGEEMGLVGMGLLIGAYFVLAMRACAVALREEHAFRRLVVVGAVVVLGTSALVNLGVAMGLLPTKGMPLPFVSYGGSALVADAWLLGLIFGVQRRQRRNRPREAPA